MSHFDHNPNALPYASPGPSPVLEGVASFATQRPAPFSQPAIPQAGGPSGPPTLNFQVVRSLRMHRKLAILCGLGVCIVLLALGFEQPQTYTASSVIYVEPMVARNLNEQGVPGFDQFRYGSFLEQQMQTIVRPDVLTAALRSLPPGTWRGPTESEQSAVARLAKALIVERASTSYQITVELKASKPENAAAIVNAVTIAYLQRGREDEFKQADLREQILSEERDRIRNELAIDRKEQASLGASMGLANPADGAGNPYDADLTNLRSQLDTARQARDVAAAQLEAVTGQDAERQSGLTASADDLINTDAGLSAKKSAVNARRVVLESMMAGITPSNPQYRQAQDEIADLDRSLEARTAEVRQQAERRIEDKLQTDLRRTAEVESKINAQLSDATSKATGAGPKLQRAAELANDIQRLTARYTTVDEALHALQVETSGPGMSHVPLPASVPLSPDSNHRNLFFMAALPLGLFFGFMAAILARLMDRRVYLGSDLQQAIGFAPIAVLPAREDVSARVADEYVLRLGAGVESAYRTAGAKSFVLTAVSPDTETGTLLRELSAKLESLRLRVQLVYASDLLSTSQETMEHQVATAALSATGVDSFVPSAKEGIGSDKLDRMKAHTDVILIDAAPLLHSAETEYAARCADAIILVVESAVTQTTELAAATSLLSQLRVTGVGAVLDRLKLEQADGSFRRAVQVIEQRSLHRSVKAHSFVSAEDAAPAASVERATPLSQTSDQVVPAEEIPDIVEPVAMQDHPVSQRTEITSFETASPAFLEADSLDLESAPDEADQNPTVSEHTEVPDFDWPTLSVSESESPAVADVAPLIPFGASASADHVLDAEMTGNQFLERLPETHTSQDECVEAAARPGTRSRFALLGNLADSAPLAQGAPWMQPASTGGESPREDAIPEAGAIDPAQPLPQRVALRAALAKMERALASASSTSQFAGDPPASGSDDPNAVGRFVGQKDTMEAVPSYTQSKIRLAFKEQEVNSKTTWFSKLFRGAPSASFRIVEDETAANNSSAEAEKTQWDLPVARLPEPVVEGDPELSHLMGRIKSSVETRVVPRAQPIAVETAAILTPVLPLPFFERRSEPRPIEIDEDPAPAALGDVVAAVQTPIDAAVPAPASPEAWQAVSAPLSEARPLRPLTFHQLSGSIEDEPEPMEEEPLEQLPFQQESAPDPQLQASATPAIFSLSHTGLPTWPADEAPLPSSAASLLPEDNSLDYELKHQSASLQTALAEGRVAARETSFSDQQAPSCGQSIAQLPSARLLSSARITVVSDPRIDPSPAQRSNRLETAMTSSQPPGADSLEADNSSPSEIEARAQTFNRRKSDQQGNAATPGLTRNWKLLSQFEPAVTDPLPALRKAYTPSIDPAHVRPGDKG